MVHRTTPKGTKCSVVGGTLILSLSSSTPALEHTDDERLFGLFQALGVRSFSAQLVCEELLLNAQEHGAGPIQTYGQREGTRVSISQAPSPRSPWRSHDGLKKILSLRTVAGEF